MIDAVEAGALTLEKLEAMTCVCSVGLDMIADSGQDTAKRPFPALSLMRWRSVWSTRRRQQSVSFR
ncbi:MAG: DUF711 family protein [Mediterraneibacter gnavus]